MTKEEFYDDPDVQEMACWMAKRFKSGLEHSYYDRGKKCNWSCNGLYDAFLKYEWKGTDWENTKEELDAFRHHLREACKTGDTGRIVPVCKCILRWGGVERGNKKYLENHKSFIVQELQHMKGLLCNDETPSKQNLCTPTNDPDKEYRMNAGFAKIYSLLCDYCVMYDSRVGAALGFLARKFCEAKREKTVPPNLEFAWAPGREGPNEKSPKNRNPSRGSLTFPRLRSNDPLFHTKQIMCANWFLHLVLEKEPNVFSKGEEGFHELAAGLFMVGYDLGDT